MTEWFLFAIVMAFAACGGFQIWHSIKRHFGRLYHVEYENGSSETIGPRVLARKHKAGIFMKVKAI